MDLLTPYMGQVGPPVGASRTSSFETTILIKLNENALVTDCLKGTFVI